MTVSISQFQFFDGDAELSITEGSLPHWQNSGCTYFITYRLADSLPSSVVHRIESERKQWLSAHGVDSKDSDWKQQIQKLGLLDFAAYQRFVAEMFEGELDSLHGDCILRNVTVATLVGDSLRFFDGIRYSLAAYVVMPNHVHVLVCFRKGHSMLKQCYGWKHFQASQINKLLGTSGPVFQAESFDHLVRDRDHFWKFCDYIANNPRKAKLKDSEYLLYLPDIENDD